MGVGSLVWQYRACNFRCSFRLSINSKKTGSLSSQARGTSLQFNFAFYSLETWGPPKGAGLFAQLENMILNTWSLFFCFTSLLECKMERNCRWVVGLDPVPRPCGSWIVVVLFIFWYLEWFSHEDIEWISIYWRRPSLKLSVCKSHGVPREHSVKKSVVLVTRTAVRHALWEVTGHSGKVVLFAFFIHRADLWVMTSGSYSWDLTLCDVGKSQNQSAWKTQVYNETSTLNWSVSEEHLVPTSYCPIEFSVMMKTFSSCSVTVAASHSYRALEMWTVHLSSLQFSFYAIFIN